MNLKVFWAEKPWFDLKLQIIMLWFLGFEGNFVT